MSATTFAQMLSAELLKLRRKRAIMAIAGFFTVGVTVLYFGISEIQHLRRRDSRTRHFQQPRKDTQHRVGLPQRTVREADTQIGRRTRWRPRALVVIDRAGAERSLNERREPLDVRAHHNHVARLERLILAQSMQHRVAKNLYLTRCTMAGMNLNALVNLGVAAR